MENEKIVEILRALEKLSSRQKKLLALFDAEGLTPDESEIRDALFEAERAQIASRAAKDAANKKLSSHSNKERRKRTQSLIEIGGLVAIANLKERDQAVILGALLEINDAMPEKIAEWKASGAKIIEQHEKEKAARKTKAFQKTESPKKTKEAA